MAEFKTGDLVEINHAALIPKAKVHFTQIAIEKRLQKEVGKPPWKVHSIARYSDGTTYLRFGIFAGGWLTSHFQKYRETTEEKNQRLLGQGKQG